MPSLKHLFRLLAGRRYHRLLLLAGILLLCWGVKGLAQAAIFVHEAVRVPAKVVDVTQKPFDSTFRAFIGGDWKAEAAYYAHVNYTIPGGHTQRNWMLPDADANDHHYGEQVEVLTMPNDPTTAHLGAWRFIWGEATALFCGGLLVTLLGWGLRGRRGPHRARRAAPRPEPRRQEQRDARPAREPEQAPRSKRRGQMELDLEVEEAPAKPKRRRKATADGAPKTPRKRKKKEVS